jgi:hypothetical protein
VLKLNLSGLGDYHENGSTEPKKALKKTFSLFYAYILYFTLYIKSVESSMVERSPSLKIPECRFHSPFFAFWSLHNIPKKFKPFAFASGKFLTSLDF